MLLRIPTLLAMLFALAACSLPSCSSTPAPPASTIEWQPWGPAAFERAAAENRPILVYVEAVWCHWCHVMDEETYGDADVARLVQERFLPIRVDSDARPDVAERYAEWGWPATAVLSPNAQPVLERRGYQEHGAFLELLQGVVDDLDAGRPIARRAPPPPPQLTGAAADLGAIRDRAEAALDGYYDDEDAGWGSIQKYPLLAPIEQALLRDSRRGGVGGLTDSIWLQRALATLAGHANLVDPAWGGMYQYSTRGDWDHPHFEKIVPVQAEGLVAFVRGYEATRDERWLRHAQQVRAYISRFLRDPDGGFYTSQDADVGSHGADASGLAVEPMDGHDFFALGDAARLARGMPRIDRNIYADRNGMLIAALTELYRASGDQTALDEATTALARIESTHRDARGLFRHAAGDETDLRHLTDQVWPGRAYLALYEVTQTPRWRTKAIEVAEHILADFQDPAGGGFFAHTVDPHATGVFVERRKPFDVNGDVARFFARLAHVTREDRWREPAERTIRALGHPEQIAPEGRMVGEFLMACEELLTEPARVTVVGWPDDPRTTALFEAAFEIYAPLVIVEINAPGGQFPDTGTPAAYVCRDPACSSPLENPRTLAAQATEFLDRLR